MALIDELKEKRQDAIEMIAGVDLDIEASRLQMAEEQRIRAVWVARIAELDIAIAALEAPAQPLDELRSVPGKPGPFAKLSEIMGDFEAGQQPLDPQFAQVYEDNRDRLYENDAPLIDAQTTDPVDPRVEQDWTPTVQPAEITVADLDKLATKASPEERAEMEGEPGGDVFVEPEIPEGFTKWEGGVCPVDRSTPVEVMFDDGATDRTEKAVWWEWSKDGMSDEYDTYHIIAYRILEAPAPEQDASVEVLDEATIETINDLWQQGYDDKANGYEPSLAEPEYTKGYEARTLIEREHRETMERAKFFDGGMMADADRHQSDQRGIVAKMFDALKSKVDA